MPPLTANTTKLVKWVFLATMSSLATSTFQLMQLISTTTSGSSALNRHPTRTHSGCSTRLHFSSRGLEVTNQITHRSTEILESPLLTSGLDTWKERAWSLTRRTISGSSVATMAATLATECGTTTRLLGCGACNTEIPPRQNNIQTSRTRSGLEDRKQAAQSTKKISCGSLVVTQTQHLLEPGTTCGHLTQRLSSGALNVA
jgi:hypothetical protein